LEEGGEGNLRGKESKEMATYIMLSTLTDEGAETIKKNPGRIKEVNKEIEALGVKVKDQYATLGPIDFVNIVEAPDNATIARVSVELSARGSVRIQTLAALPMSYPHPPPPGFSPLMSLPRPYLFTEVTV